MATQTAFMKGSASTGYRLNQYTYGSTAVPTSAAAAGATATALVDTLYLDNTTSAGVLVTVTDNSIEIGGTGPATIWIGTVPANTAVNASLVIDLKGKVANGGIKWVAGGAGVHGQIAYRLSS
jgi:hypothetical protein